MPERRNAVITGAASGLGRALALRLAREGWHIAICDINDAASEETLRLVKSAGGSGQVEHLDVTDAAAWQRLREKLGREWPQIDLLANNAGVAGGGNMGEYPLEDWDWIIKINLYNGIYGCHYFVDWLKQNPRGSHIINTASMAAIASAPGMAAYNVTKAGMLALSETLYAELMPHNVGVTVLCPSFFATNLLTTGRFAKDDWRKLAQKAFDISKFTADDVAAQAISAMRAKRLYVLVPFDSKFRWWFKRLMPTVFLKQVAKMFSRAGKSIAQGEPAPAPQPAAERQQEVAGSPH
jgi:NAD(P)-dependent dehydrogenase (short-subunit alcohol dehydrogenase family)